MIAHAGATFITLADTPKKIQSAKSQCYINVSSFSTTMLVKDTVCAVHVEQEPIKNRTGESLVTIWLFTSCNQKVELGIQLVPGLHSTTLAGVLYFMKGFCTKLQNKKIAENLLVKNVILDILTITPCVS